MSIQFWGYLLCAAAVTSASPITSYPDDEVIREQWNTPSPTLPDEIPVQKLQPDPFDLTEKASMMELPVMRPAVVEAQPAEEGPQALIPVEVWISLGLMVASFVAYLWVATIDDSR